MSNAHRSSSRDSTACYNIHFCDRTFQDASPEEKQRIVVYLIQAVIAVIQGSIRARRILVERKAFQNICEGIKFCDVISEPVLKAFIGLATEEIALSPRLGVSLDI